MAPMSKRQKTSLHERARRMAAFTISTTCQRGLDLFARPRVPEAIEPPSRGSIWARRAVTLVEEYPVCLESTVLQWFLLISAEAADEDSAAFEEPWE